MSSQQLPVINPFLSSWVLVFLSSLILISVIGGFMKNLIMQNEPKLKSPRILVNSFPLWTKDYRRWTESSNNEPKTNPNEPKYITTKIRRITKKRINRYHVNPVNPVKKISLKSLCPLWQKTIFTKQTQSCHPGPRAGTQRSPKTPLPKPEKTQNPIPGPKNPNPIHPMFCAAQKPHFQLPIPDSPLRTPNYELRTAFNPQTQKNPPFALHRNPVSNSQSPIPLSELRTMNSELPLIPKPNSPHLLSATRTPIPAQDPRFPSFYILQYAIYNRNPQTQNTALSPLHKTDFPFH